MQSRDHTIAFVAALTGSPETVMDWRAIHDARADLAAIPFRGSIDQCWTSIVHYNDQGYGIFCTVSAMDGVGRELSNVASIRAHYIDLDNLSAQQNYERATTAQPAPSFAVSSSPSKFHVYWPSHAYLNNDRFSAIQRKLRQVFDADKSINDATRVMRVPGSIHRKGAPHLVTMHALAGYGTITPPEALEAALAGVTVIDGGTGERHALGDPDLAAPSWEWAKRALELADPNMMDRSEWISVMCGFKQAAWNVASEADIWTEFSAWCARYELDDPAENCKQFNSIRSTSLGWKSLVSRVPSLRAMFHLDKPVQAPQPQAGEAPMPMPEPQPLDCTGTILTDLECREWFKGCTGIETMNSILTPSGRFMDAGSFNMRYGGKAFIYTGDGKTTDEPWKAALRSQLWTIPKVDHTRFLPDEPFGAIIHDQLQRPGVNTYIPIKLDAKPGDITPFLRHMELMLPIESDRRQFIEYLAHGIKYPGEKIAWAPLIQSTEGVGKGFIAETIEHVIGQMYCYSPKAQELVKSGSTFNAWMRAKLFIVVNEVKVDEKRELIEILKPMISEPRIEVQSKGVDQDMEDNPAQWIFFSQWKDAIPVSANGRRYAIYYSAIQSHADLVVRGMDDAYFDYIFAWMKADGHKHIAHYLLSYPIERGAISRRAPVTSCSAEAVRVSQGPVERLILDAVSDAIPGFCGGWVSSVTLAKQIKAAGSRQPAAQTLETIMAGLGYTLRGRAPKPYFQESGGDNLRSTLWHVSAAASVEDFAAAQGWSG